MKFYVTLLLVSLAVAFSLAGGQGTSPKVNSPCGVVAQALKDSEQVKVGVARREVEKYFEREGGVQFPSSTRYIYAKCPYLHIDVKFEPKAIPGQLFSPDDLVAETSKLYVGYSTKD